MTALQRGVKIRGYGSLSPRFDVHSFMRSWDNIDWSFGWGLRTPILGKRRPYGVGDGTVRKSVGEFPQALHINCSSIFTRFRDIAAFVLQHATFPTPLLVSPKFPHAPLGVGKWPLGYEERRCWANCIYYYNKYYYLLDYTNLVNGVVTEGQYGARCTSICSRCLAGVYWTNFHALGW